MARRMLGKIEEPGNLLYRNNELSRTLNIGLKSAPPRGILHLNDKEAMDVSVQQWLATGSVTYLGPETGILNTEGGLLFDFFDRENPRTRGSILASRTYAYGDLFLTSAFIESVAMAYPDQQIEFHTSPLMEPLVRNHPDADIIVGQKELQSALKTAGIFLMLDNVPELYEEKAGKEVDRNRIEILCYYAGIDSVKTLCPSYFMTDNEVDMGFRVVQKYPEPYIGISPSSIRKEKCWPPEMWQKLAWHLAAETDGTVFIFDDKAVLHCDHPRVIDFVGKSLRTCGAVAYHMKCFVTQDSLWTHWSAALGIPQVLLSSCTDGALLSKGYPDTIVIQRTEWECCPCWYNFSDGGCIYGNYPRCLEDVSVMEVADRVMEILNG